VIENVDGPIGTSKGFPYGSATAGQSEQARLLKEFDYLEEEFFVSGTANVYGPISSEPVESYEQLNEIEPLSTLWERDVPYKTRVLVIRPREGSRFSGIVHAIPFHNLGAGAQVERHILRDGHVWVGVEVCSGTRFGKEEIPSGGIANLHRTDPDRYGTLHLGGGKPEHWPNLQPGLLGKAFETINFSRQGWEMVVFRQELARSYAQGPDIYFSVVDGLRSGRGSVLPGSQAQRVYTSGASGGTEILRPLAQYHHDAWMRPDGGPILDGYFILVGQIPEHRPSKAAVVVFQTEAEALTAIDNGWTLPADTDEPKFRYYEIPGTGHKFSAVPRGAPTLADVLPGGIRGLSERDVSEEYDPYDKFNAPIVWALWDHLYRWVDGDGPMPRAPRITRDPEAPDGIARDEHGNALGGLRTPWVDVPDARYVARISPGNPLSPGMKRFDDKQMRALYGSQEEYARRIRARLDQMVQEGFLLKQDTDLMFS
jgi:Alpha/beta hydrolase domain